MAEESQSKQADATLDMFGTEITKMAEAGDKGDHKLALTILKNLMNRCQKVDAWMLAESCKLRLQCGDVRGAVEDG